MLGLDFGRIQFTPDLMPGDILGSNLFNFQTSQFTLTRGPVFCELLLADEINRTPPKTQAALLEAMQERAVTIDGETHALPPRFMVIATQNPIEQQGVYPLPEAQLDRFLFKHRMGYPSAEEEAKIVAGHGARFGAPRARGLGDRAQDRRRRCSPKRSRRSRRSRWSATSPIMSSPGPRDPRGARPRRRRFPARRGACWPAPRARARRWTGATMSSPTTSRRSRPAVLRHRVLLSAAAEIEGRPVEGVIERLIQEIEAPR